MSQQMAASSKAKYPDRSLVHMTKTAGGLPEIHLKPEDASYQTGREFKSKQRPVSVSKLLQSQKWTGQLALLQLCGMKENKHAALTVSSHLDRTKSSKSKQNSDQIQTAVTFVLETFDRVNQQS